MAGEHEGATMAPKWWARAVDDLRAAEIVLESDDGAPWVAAYHAQQAAEKSIKAYLVAHGVSTADRSFRVHEIDDLRRLVRDHDQVLAAALSTADSLGDFAVEVRYPPVAPGVEDITQDEAITALDTAREAMTLVHEQLSRRLPNLPAPVSADTRRTDPTQ